MCGYSQFLFTKSSKLGIRIFLRPNLINPLFCNWLRHLLTDNLDVDKLDANDCMPI